MAKSQERTPQNTFRFIPCRPEAAQDGKMLFGGTRYSRRASGDAQKGFLAGVAIGPGQHLSTDDPGPGFQLSPGGVIVPAFPNKKLETVPVRDFTPPGDKLGKAKQYIDWATFQKHGADLFRVVPCEEDQVAYLEVWTGDIVGAEATYQLVQADMFLHGSVPFVGKDTLLIDARSTAKAKKAKQGAEAAPEQENLRATQAQLICEQRGRMIGGYPMWLAGLWRIAYSTKDSEAALVRQLNRFWIVPVELCDSLDGSGRKVYRPNPHEVPASRYEKHFERLMGDKLTAEANKAQAGSAAGGVVSAAA
jgi:hypothetical protein